MTGRMKEERRNKRFLPASSYIWSINCYEKMSQGSNFFRIIVHIDGKGWNGKEESHSKIHFSIPNFRFTSWKSYAWRLYPKTRNHGKGMLEVSGFLVTFGRLLGPLTSQPPCGRFLAGKGPVFNVQSVLYLTPSRGNRRQAHCGRRCPQELVNRLYTA